MSNSRNNREYAVITYLFLAIFIGLMGYFVYFQVVKSEDFINSSYNTRTDSFANTIVRGTIYSNDGTALAQTTLDGEGNEVRNYPYGSMFAHVVGYATNGKAGIESMANFYLLRSHAFVLEKIANELKGEKSQGDNVITTLDYDLQAAAYNALGDQEGAVMVLEPSTGKILAMVSKPDYDPNTISANWDSIINSESSVLLNRATQGLYPPGSTFKILTALEYMRENSDYENYSFDCTGSVTVEDSVINCYANSVHGTENLDLAFAKSCNSFFSTIGLTLKPDSFQSLAESFLFNKSLPIAFEYKKSSFALSDTSTTSQIMQTSIGQGETLVTPIHMAMIVSAIANDGVLMKPYVIDHTENYQGVNVKNFSTSEYGNIMKEEEAQKLQALMSGVVANGTASALSGQVYAAAGKTGSAEYSDVKGQSHAWFVGYASKDSESTPDLAVAVIVEGAGAGSTYAVPIAKQIFDTYYSGN